MTEFGPFGRVYVENEWYDGPRAGPADINGIPHRSKSLFDEKEDEYLSSFLVWPASDKELELEIEQWRIFVEWNTRYESAEVDTKSHPGHGEISDRWDEIEGLLKGCRLTVPLDAKRMAAQLESIGRERRYDVEGPDYQMSWKVL